MPVGTLGATATRNLMTYSRFSLVALVAVVVVGCAVNPATGARQLMLISESQEIAMGRDYDQQVAASIGLYADTAWQRWIQQFGARLAATSERPKIERASCRERV